MSTVFSALRSWVTPAMVTHLLQPYSADEVKAALFQIHTFKSPDPDGFSSLFYHRYWHIVRDAMTTLTLQIL